jgi:hypothetical protein
LLKVPLIDEIGREGGDLTINEEEEEENTD